MMNQEKNLILRGSTASLEFRIWFKDEFGIDYLDALEKLRDDQRETERNWHQVLVKYNLINN